MKQLTKTTNDVVLKMIQHFPINKFYVVKKETPEKQAESIEFVKSTLKELEDAHIISYSNMVLDSSIDMDTMDMKDHSIEVEYIFNYTGIKEYCDAIGGGYEPEFLQAVRVYLAHAVYDETGVDKSNLPEKPTGDIVDDELETVLQLGMLAIKTRKEKITSEDVPGLLLLVEEFTTLIRLASVLD